LLGISSIVFCDQLKANFLAADRRVAAGVDLVDRHARTVLVVFAVMRLRTRNGPDMADLDHRDIRALAASGAKGHCTQHRYEFDLHELSSPVFKQAGFPAAEMMRLSAPELALAPIPWSPHAPPPRAAHQPTRHARREPAGRSRAPAPASALRANGIRAPDQHACARWPARAARVEIRRLQAAQ